MSMKKTYVAKLAIKNIFAHKLRSFLTIAGIAIGVGFIIFLISLGYGLQRLSTTEIANINALQIIDVTPGKSKIIEINEGTMEKFNKLANVEKTASQVNVVANVSQGTSVMEGVVYGKNRDFLEMEEPELETGKIYSSNFNKEALVNRSVLKQLGTTPEKIVGKTITLKMILPKELFGNEADEPKVQEDAFKVSGVLKNESSPYVYVPLESFKEYGVVNYSAVKVKISDKKYTDIAKGQIENLGYKTATIKDTVDQINQFFVIFQLILLSFGAIAVIIAAIGMFNTLTISLLEKTREISFMKVMGTTSRDIWQLFLGEAIIIGILGGSIGITGGLFGGYALNDFLIGLAEKTGNRPVELFYAPLVFVIITFVSALLISVLTGIYPSFRASRIDPLEAMRYE